jgi:ArsR family transcriptional regulator, arsenate/arsenite/antimonite-responsive transcriptional repressor
MISTKEQVYKEGEIELAAFAKALSHPARIKILTILGQTNSCFCGDLVELLPLSQSTVSQHLKELKNVGLIQGEIDGPKTCYCLNPKTIEKVKKILNSLFDKIS